MSSDPFAKQIIVLRAKKGGHVYHIIQERKRGEKVAWLVKRPDDEMFEAWLSKEKVLELAEPAWEWDESIKENIEKARIAIEPLIDVNADFNDTWIYLRKCLDHIEKLRNGEL